MNVEHSLDKQNDGIGDRLDVPFIFNRTTDIGQIKLVDIFLTVLQRRIISTTFTLWEDDMKKLLKGVINNQLYSRKDNNFNNYISFIITVRHPKKY